LGSDQVEGAEEVRAQLIEKLLLTENGLPPKEGTRTARNRAATQAAVGVPENGAPVTLTLCGLPLGAKTMTTCPVPVGPPDFLHAEAPDAAALRRVRASARLKGAASNGAAALGVARGVGAIASLDSAAELVDSGFVSAGAVVGGLLAGSS
jgi:hypothetical protein